MKKIIGGAMAIILGTICLWKFPQPFLNFLAGLIPLILLLSGCLMIYLKRQEEYPDSNAKVDCRDIPDCQKTDEIMAATRPGPEVKINAKPGDDTPRWVGNTGSFIFHSLDCKFAESKNCTVVFDLRETAVQDGYKPCRLCNP